MFLNQLKYNQLKIYMKENWSGKMIPRFYPLKAYRATKRMRTF